MLSHHEILRLVAPLTRLGARVDLPRCERGRRWIVFMPESVAELDSAGHTVACDQCLALDASNAEALRLARVISCTSVPLVSVVDAIGTDVAALHTQLCSVPVDRQIVATPAGLVARHYRVPALSDNDAPTPVLRLVEALIPLARQRPELASSAATLRLSIDSTPAGNWPADLYLCAGSAHRTAQGAGRADGRSSRLADGEPWPDDDPLIRAAANRTDSATRAPTNDKAPGRTASLALPDDLLAVIGPHWQPLTRRDDGWRSTLECRSREPARSRWVERHASDALAHLGSVFSQPPSRFHAHFADRRWRVYLRRLKPLGLLLAILAVAPLMYLAIRVFGDAVRPVGLTITPLLMAAAVFLSAREIPTMVWPPRPAPLPDGAWPGPADER